MLAALLLSSCQKPPVSAPAPEVETKAEASFQDAPDLFLDATPSMRGFLSVGEEAPFGHFLQAAEGAIQQLFSKPARLFRFGTMVEPWPAGEITQRFLPSSYEMRKGFEDNDLSVVIPKLERKRLAVIITDLFQSDNDVNTVTGKLLERVVRDGSSVAIGVLGIKVKFNGSIYDLGAKRGKMEHNGPRPAYILLIGQRPELQELIQMMQQRIRKDPVLAGVPLEAAIFSSEVAEVPALDTLTRDAKQEEFFLYEGIEPDSSVMAGTGHSLAREFRLRRGVSAGSWQIRKNVKLHALSGFAATPGPIPVRVTMTRYSPGAKPVWTDAKQAAPTCSAETKPPQQGLISVHMKCALPQAIPGEGDVYRAELSVGPGRGQIETPLWVRNWSFTELSRPDGAKTLNLDGFLTNLAGGLAMANPPVLLKSYVYLRKE